MLNHEFILIFPRSRRHQRRSEHVKHGTISGFEQVTSDDIRNLAEVFTEKEQEGVVNAAVVMGFLNRFM